MGDRIRPILIFVAGATVGSVCTWYAVKTKYEQIANEEIESVKAVFSNKTKETKEIEVVTAETKKVDNKPDLMEYASKVNKLGYDKYSDGNPIEEDPEESESDVDIERIPPDEFGDDDPGYDTSFLTYYKDGILADNERHIVNIRETIGYDALDAIGEWTDDAVHVRNNTLEIDYEVLQVDENYKEE